MEKQYNHKELESRMQLLWKQEGTYLATNNSGPLYGIDTPPPTVSGALHIGHIFSYTQTDIIARYTRMSGFSVFYPFGFDDNGLPTERYVEKKLEVSSYALGRSAFIKLCLEETKRVEHQFKNLWQRIGLSVDWNACYSTISDQTRALSQESFIRLVQKGHIYRAYEPALFCAGCRTSVAQAELDDAQKPSMFNDIVFQDHQGRDLIVGTTRPELLPGCVALLYNPDDERYQYLQGTQATVPLYNFTVPVFADESVSIEKGTGLVMCCTFGDKTDIAWYKKFKLPYKQIIGMNGKWTELSGPLAGMSAHAARKKVVELLQEKNLLIRQQPITHAVNVHERCKQEIEYLALSQWFIKILENKQVFLDMADRIAWYPAFMKARYKNWVENISWDWCISRQRFFGIPFPAWHCLDCNQIILANINDLPIDPQEVPYAQPCPTCKGSNIVSDTDVMDTWNTSSITPYLCYQLYAPQETSPFVQQEPPAFIPMSMRPQAHDIIRTWAFYTIVKTWMHHGTIPWNSIVISGHVLADTKEKISKSRENNKLAPETLLEQYPADVIRYWTATGSLGHDSPFSDNQLKIGQRLVTKLWNAFKFVHEHGVKSVRPEFIEGYERPSYGSTSSPRTTDLCNEWILHTASATFNQYQHYFSTNEFGLALGVVEKFFWSDFCDNYLELIKHQMFNPHEYDAATQQVTRETLHAVGLRILQLYAPYVPHITELLYQEMYRSTVGTPSLHQTRFANIQTTYSFESSVQIMQKVIDLVAQVRRLKTERQLSLKTPLQALTVYTPDQALLEALQQQAPLIRGVTQAVVVQFQIGNKISTLEHTGDELQATVGMEK